SSQSTRHSNTETVGVISPIVGELQWPNIPQDRGTGDVRVDQAHRPLDQRKLGGLRADSEHTLNLTMLTRRNPPAQGISFNSTNLSAFCLQQALLPMKAIQDS